MSPQSTLAHAMVRTFHSCWKELVLTDVVFKAIAFVALTPLVGLLFQAALAVSGSGVLSDQDILFFFLGPAGWVSFIVVGAVALAIIALEQAALLGITAASQQHRKMGIVEALRFAAANAWPVLRVAVHMAVRVLLLLAPFVAAGWLAYASFLTQFDINYYLKARPPAFQAAAGIAILLAAALSALLLRVFTNWFYALPLVLFERVPCSRALWESRRRAAGHRRRILIWIVGWLLATVALSLLTTAAVATAGRFLIPRSAASLPLLTVSTGLVLVFWFLAGTVVNLLSTTSFATVLFSLYRILGGGDTRAFRPVPASEADDRPALRLTRRRILVAVLAGVVIAAGAPENTLAAVQQAVADGADWVEVDVQEAADGEVVVFHDSDFKKLSGLDLKIWDATMADLKNIDIGGWFSPEFRNQRVPTLAQVLDMCRGKIRVGVEQKYYGYGRDLEQRAVDIVEAHGMTGSVMIMSLKPEAVRKTKALRPDWKVGLLLTVAAGTIKGIDTDFLAVTAGFAARNFIAAVHAGKKDVYVWTVNDASTMSTMVGRGVDGLITDRPALARSVLTLRAEMGLLERLATELPGVLGVLPRFVEQQPAPRSNILDFYDFNHR